MGRRGRSKRGAWPQVGLDIGRQSIRLVRLEPTATPPVVLTAGQTVTPAGLFSDGQITNRDALSDCLRQLAAELGMARAEAVLAVNGPLTSLFPLDLTPTEAGDLAEQVTAAAVARCGRAADELAVSWQALAPPDEAADRLRLMVSVTSRQLVADLTTAVERAGLEPIVIDVEALAAAYALGREDQTLRLWGDWGAGQRPTRLPRGREVRRTLRVEQGGESITRAIAAAAGWDRSTAERWKRLDLVLDDETTAPAVRVAGEVVDEVLRQLGDWLAAEPETSAPEEILLYGGGAGLPGLSERLELRLGLPTRLADPFRELALSGAEAVGLHALREAASYVIAVGLAMRQALVER